MVAVNGDHIVGAVGDVGLGYGIWPENGVSTGNIGLVGTLNTGLLGQGDAAGIMMRPGVGDTGFISSQLCCARSTSAHDLVGRGVDTVVAVGAGTGDNSAAGGGVTVGCAWSVQAPVSDSEIIRAAMTLCIIRNLLPL